MKRKLLSLATASFIFLSSTSIAFADYNFSLPIYKSPMYHNDVKAIQGAMIKGGFLNIKSTTTYYGPLTTASIISFQRKYGLVADGIVGSNTIAKMNSLGLLGNETASSNHSVSFSMNIYKLGIRHSDVSTIQRALKNAGTFNYHTITNYYGNITKQAVIDFQRKYGLSADGIVGKNTIAKMEGLGLFGGTTVSANRSSSSRETYGEYLDWWSDVKGKILNDGDIITAKDLYTGKVFKLRAVTGSNHMDVETLTLEDTRILKEIWGGFSWSRRPVIVTVNGHSIAASLNGMPHAGRDDKPYGEYVYDRSLNYGYGYNLDLVKGNGMSGVICLHFKNSKLHKNGQVDEKHQEAVKKAAGLK